MRDTKPLLALSVKAMRKREGECHGPHGRETPEEEEEVNISVTRPPVAVSCFGELKWLLRIHLGLQKQPNGLAWA